MSPKILVLKIPLVVVGYGAVGVMGCAVWRVRVRFDFAQSVATMNTAKQGQQKRVVCLFPSLPLRGMLSMQRGDVIMQSAMAMLLMVRMVVFLW